jgi:hypothetical protein
MNKLIINQAAARTILWEHPVQDYFSHYVQYNYNLKDYKNKLYKDEKKIRKVKKYC